MDNLQTFGIDLILNIKITNVNVAGVASAGVSTVFLHFHSTLVILVEGVLFQCITLCLHKVLHRNVVQEIITRADHFGFRRTFRIEALLTGLAANDARTERHGATSVALHIRMNGITSVDESVELIETVNPNDTFVIDGLGQELEKTPELFPVVNVAAGRTSA